MTERRDERAELDFVVEHGTSPEAQAVRVLRRFMTCEAGRKLVEHGLLRPYRYPTQAEHQALQDSIAEEVTAAAEQRILNEVADRLEALLGEGGPE